MRCPECNTEILDPKSRFCPNCGSPVNAAEASEVPAKEGENKKKKSAADDPQLSRGMMLFIVVGLLFLIGFSAYQYMAHKDDPEYTRTAIDPDSNLADKNTVKFDTLVPDTAKRDSIRRAEKREAEKILNSIRKKPVEEEANNENPETSGEGTNEGNSAATPSESNTPTAEPAPITAPKPKIEQIENE